MTDLSTEAVIQSLTRSLGPGWIPVPAPGSTQVGVVHPAARLSVLVEVIYLDGEPWVHTSLAARDRPPTPEEGQALRQAALGPGPAEIQHLNHSDPAMQTLHLWGRTDPTERTP